MRSQHRLPGPRQRNAFVALVGDGSEGEIRDLAERILDSCAIPAEAETWMEERPTQPGACVVVERWNSPLQMWPRGPVVTYLAATLGVADHFGFRAREAA